MSGRHSRNKGARFEREVVNTFQDAGIGAERVPLSGACGGSYSGDVSLPVMGCDVTLECKIKASGFKFIYDSLGDNYGLVFREDRNRALVAIPLDTFIELVGKASSVTIMAWEG